MGDQLTEKAVSMTDDRGELISLVACLGNAIQAEPETFYERPLQTWPEWISEQGFDSQCLIGWVNAAAQTSNLSTIELHQFYAEQAKSGSTTASFLAQLHERSPQFVEVLRASMQELGEEAESLQQVAGGTSAMKGHPYAIAGIGVVCAAVGVLIIGSIDNCLNQGRIRKYLFESGGTGEAGNIAQDAGQVILRDDQQLIKEDFIKNSNAIENSSLVERQKINFIIRPGQEAQADVTVIREAKNDPKMLVADAKQKLIPGEFDKFLSKVANSNLDALERASWKAIISDENIASTRNALNKQIEKSYERSLAKIKQIDVDISEILSTVDPKIDVWNVDKDISYVSGLRMDSIENVALEYWKDTAKTDYKITNLILNFSWENQVKKSEVMVKYQKLSQARKEEQYLVKEVTRFENNNLIRDADLYKQYYQKIISDNPIKNQELLDKEEARAARVVKNEIGGEANQVISADLLNMADSAIKGDGIEAVSAAEQVVSEELKIEAEEIEDEMVSAVEKKEDKVINKLL